MGARCTAHLEETLHAAQESAPCGTQRAKMLEFALSYLTGPGWIRYETMTVCVLMPEGTDEEAEKVVKLLGGS